MGDFEKKFPASTCWKKKIACGINEIEKILALLQARKKNVAKLFHHSWWALQNPSKTAAIPDNQRATLVSLLK